jgi:endonuclease/exonuclease/phosphatase family metal-dependent hydrolase
VAILEIRDPTYEAIEKLEQQTNALGVDYSYIIGPSLGRTSSKEQYAYMYKVGVVAPEGFYTYEDPANTFHRPPLIAKFKANNGTLGFVLITVHTDPDEAKEEIDALPKVLEDAKEHFPGEKDFIILGDLNADCTYFEEDDMSSPLRDPQYTWLIDSSVDTSLASESCVHNRIIVTTAMAKEDYASAMGSGAFRFDEAFGLSPNQAKQVSDHYPVFSTFFTERDTD